MIQQLTLVEQTTSYGTSYTEVYGDGVKLGFVQETVAGDAWVAVSGGARVADTTGYMSIETKTRAISALVRAAEWA